MNESVDSDALVIPSSTVLPAAGLAARFEHAIVLLAELELVDDLFRQEFGIADVVHLHPAHHLTGDHFQVLVVDVDALQTIDFLDFVHQVFLQVLFAHHGHDVVRVARTVHQRIAVTNALAFLNVDVNAARNRVFLGFAIVGDDVDLAHALRDLAVLHDSVDFRDHSGLARLARFEQFDHARQTARDVLGLGGRARDLGEHVAGVNFVAVRHHKCACIGIR